MNAKKKTIKIKLIRGTISCPKDQKDTVLGLGLKHPGNTSELEDTPSVRGMINKVIHLVEVER